MPIRILIADDNAFVRTAMREVLESVEPEWEIIEADGGREAVAKAQELRPALIILDLVMPSMDGLTAARKIGKLMPDIPVMMHTMYWSPRVTLLARTVGVKRVVAKSDSSALISAVRDLLQGSAEAPQSEVRPSQ